MSKHTPGPWVVDDAGHLSGAMKRPIAELYYDSARLELVANANLIAAAPEMLEVLRSYGDSLGCFNECRRFGLQGHSPRCERARTAIAKAEGDSHD